MCCLPLLSSICTGPINACGASLVDVKMSVMMFTSACLPQAYQDSIVAAMLSPEING